MLVDPLGIITREIDIYAQRFGFDGNLKIRVSSEVAKRLPQSRPFTDAIVVDDSVQGHAEVSYRLGFTRQCR